MRNSVQVFFVSIVVLLLFQWWLAEYHTAELSETPPFSIEGAGTTLPFETAFGDAYNRAVGAGIEMPPPEQLLWWRTMPPPEQLLWWRTAGLPKVLDRKFNQLATVRYNAARAGGNSLIDSDVQFHSAPEFLWYAPRALQVGMLSPMPELWTGKASTPAMTLARKVVGVVTVFFYVCLISLVAGLFIFRKQPALWVMLLFCLLGVLVYTYVYPNVGSLMRYRYGFYTMLIAFGAAFMAERALNWQVKRRKNG